jgi:hypothetical protein
MTTRWVIFAAAAATGAMVRPSFAQPNLPPPPPPPIGQSTDVPSLPPPPEPSSSSDRTPPPPVRKATPSTPPPSPSPSPRVGVGVGPRARRTDDVAVAESSPPSAHPAAVTLSPLGLVSGRLSAGVEVQIQPHHAIVASANALVFDASRGGPHNLVSEGFGFATNLSSGFGGEVGYHYWVDWAHVLRGAFVGPSFLFGGTSQASVGDPSHAQTYWGLALDGGWQEVFDGGFTAGAGGGLEMLRMAGTSAVVPRFLAQLGWSF